LRCDARGIYLVVSGTAVRAEMLVVL
jgi:hypothetical protein